MSNTYRKLNWHETLEEHLVKEYHYWLNRPYDTVARKKPKAQYEAELRKDQARYDREVKANGGTDYLGTVNYPWGSYPRYIRRVYVPRKYYVKVPITWEDRKAKAIQDWNARFRDGYWAESGRNQGFKREANRSVRRSNKALCKKVIADDWEDMAYPIRKEGKAYKWNWF